MDHRIALKGFRQSSTVKSILPRMSLIDTYDEQRERFQQRPPTENETDCEEIVWQITEKDLGFIIPTAKMILKVADSTLQISLCLCHLRFWTGIHKLKEVS